MENFIIVKDATKRVRRFNLLGRTLEFKLKAVPEGVEPVGWVKDAVSQVLRKAMEGLQPQDQVGLSFCSKDFKSGDGWIRFQEAAKVAPNDVWAVISSVYQSNSVGLNTDTFCLGVTSVRMPIGKGRGKGRHYSNFEEECNKRRGIVAIANNDNLCLPRAIVVAMAHATKDSAYRNIRKDTGKLQTQRATQLLTDAGVSIPPEGAGIEELKTLQHHLKGGYKLVVYKYSSKGRDVIFNGCGSETTNLNLLYHDGHYNVITSLTSAFCCIYYCEECHIPYDHKDKHRCGGICQACQQTPACSKTNIKVKCDDCQRIFRGQECYDNHKKVGKQTVCETIRRCSDCCKTVKADRQHTCGEVFCKICNTHVPTEHLCYIQQEKGTPKTRDILFVFYDLEARQETVLESGHKHEPNLCVFNQRCDECMDTGREQILCNKCGVRQQVLKCNEPVARFVEYVLAQRKLFKSMVVVAHNGQAYDHQFILNHILTKTDIKPQLIMRGTKILLMTVDNVKFLDSLNYFPMALTKLPKAFGLGDEFKKGYFPHLFNTKANEKYVGALPNIQYYDPDSMKEGDRAIFLNWHQKHKNDEFNMQRDIVDYCKTDVEILMQACLKFRKQLMTVGNVCPFTEACTIASACNKVFRRNFLKPETIGIIPKNGYRWCDNQSKIAIQWLIWEENQREITIIHAAKEKEAIIKGVKVDGYCKETRQVFEFYGCYFHGCPSCFKHNRDVPLQDSETLNSRYEWTVAKSERLRSFDYAVIEMWECEFRRQLADNPEIETQTKNHPLNTQIPLNPRDAFYGGRTGNCYKHYKVKQNEKIKYVDVCSLYPWVCKYGKFPLGHPQVITEDEKTIEGKDGLIKCKILPPQELNHPILPVKMLDKLMFILCRTCGEQMNQSDCSHSVEQRALTGTWTTDEVKKALETGYTMLEIYEIWHYDKMEQYNKLDKTGGLFTEMMNKFIKVKQQASGWPGECITEERKNQYVEAFYDTEDIRLDVCDIAENPGMRSLAKLMLNSFWGKFGQRENQAKTKIINTTAEFFEMLTNPSISVNSVLPINENTLVVNYEFIDEAADQLPVVNVCIASYVTAQARLKLYSYLEKLNDRVLYYDTDSVIYISREGDYDVPTGQLIGDMTDELEIYGDGSFITEFVSGGPKNYAYKVWSTKNQCEEVVCKVKGISLTYKTSQLINFDKIRDMVLEEFDPVPILSRNIRRTADHQVVTKDEVKMYRPNSTKRKFLECGDSIPYGFKKTKLHM